MNDVTEKNTVGVITSPAKMKLIHYTDVSPESIERIAEAVAKRLAKPERKKGKWLVDEDGNMECPFCGNTCGFGNYCNECGADMRGENDE